MSKTVYFYNVGVYLNDQLTDISFSDLMDNINLHQSERLKLVRQIDDKITGVFEFIPQPEKNIRIIPFGKFRTTFKPFIGEIINTKLDQINKNVVELVTLTYDEFYKVACMNYNQYGLKIKDIEKYLNTFFPNKNNEKWEVKFEPIIIYKDVEKIEKTNQITKISISLNLNDTRKNFIKQSTNINVNFLSAFASSAEKDFDANVLKLEFGIGNKRNASMDLEAVLYLLNLLNLDTDYIKNVEVTFKDNSVDKIDIINLKNSKIELKDKVLVGAKAENPMPEVIGLDMKNKIEKYQKILTRAYRNYITDSINAVIPDIVINPKPDNDISINNLNTLHIVKGKLG